jgi:hypothetical protein
MEWSVLWDLAANAHHAQHNQQGKHNHKNAAQYAKRGSGYDPSATCQLSTGNGDLPFLMNLELTTIWALDHAYLHLQR